MHYLHFQSLPLPFNIRKFNPKYKKEIFFPPTKSYVREDTTNMFMECSLVREAWGWVRLRLLSVLPDRCGRTFNFEFLSFMFEKSIMDKEAVWLIGAFLEFVWKEKLMKKRIVKLQHLVGYIELKFKANMFSK